MITEVPKMKNAKFVGVLTTFNPIKRSKPRYFKTEEEMGRWIDRLYSKGDRFVAVVHEGPSVYGSKYYVVQNTITI